MTEWVSVGERHVCQIPVTDLSHPYVSGRGEQKETLLRLSTRIEVSSGVLSVSDVPGSPKVGRRERRARTEEVKESE